MYLSQNDDAVKALVEHNKAVLLKALREAGAVKAIIEYDGENDSGGVIGTGIYAADGSTITPTICVTIREGYYRYDGITQVYEERSHELVLPEALAMFAEMLVGLYHRGYENHTGGGGSVHFDCAADQIRIEHDDHYVASERTDTEL